MSQYTLEDIKNEVLKEEVEFWSSISGYFKKALEQRSNYIQLADLVAQIKEIGETELIDFVDGLTLLKIAFDKNDQESKDKAIELITPVFNAIFQHIKSDNYQKSLIKEYIDDDETLKIKELSIPISPKKLLRFIKDKNVYATDGKDVLSAQKQYIDHRNRLFLNKDSETNEDYKKVAGYSSKDRQYRSTNKAKKLTLLDIWLKNKHGDKKEYDEVIEFLKKEQLPIDNPFVSEINGKLYWNKIPIKGFRQYLVGFFYTCIDKGWIKKEHSGKKITDIIYNTFDLRVNENPFKSIATNPPKDKYLEPFVNFPENN